MINRELIRLKVVQLVYANYKNEGKTVDVAMQELMFSLAKSYELYKYLLTLLVALRDYAARKDESSRNRAQRLGTSIHGLTPDSRFADNALLHQLAANQTLADYVEKEKKPWPEEDGFVKKLYDQMVESDIFAMYMTKEDFSYEADREVVRKLYKTFVCHCDDLDAMLEDHSLYWNDDKEIVDSFVLKTIKRFHADSAADQPLLPQFASDDDRQFAETLFTRTLKQHDELQELVRANCRNWKLERMPFMDVIIAEIAICELLNFPTIPLSVTINEYLDIAKVYSTPRSASFLNGLLDHVARQLFAEGRTMKRAEERPKKVEAEAEVAEAEKPRRRKISRPVGNVPGKPAPAGDEVEAE